MQKYELLYIVPAKHTEDELKGLTEKIGTIISTTGCAITETHVLGRRKLAYPIKHERNGYYIMVTFDAEKPVIEKMDKALRLSPDLLRHLIIKKDPRLTEMPEFAESGEIVRKDRGEEAPRGRAVKPKRPPVKEKKEKVVMEDLDKKLDEILTEEME